MIKITNGPWSAEFVTIGASLLNLNYNNAPLLRDVPKIITSGMDSAAYPLVPYPGRIRNQKIVFNGITHDVSHCREHALHGDPVDRDYLIEYQDKAQVTFLLPWKNLLSTTYPFPYSVKINYSLSNDGFEMKMEIKNEGSKPAPFGAGFHPFFRRTLPNSKSHLELKADIGNIFAHNGDVLPSSKPIVHKYDYSKWEKVLEPQDHTFAYFKSPALLRWADSDITLALSSTCSSFLHIYTGQEDSVAIEPTTMVPNGFELAERDIKPHGVKVIAPNACLHFETQIRLI